MKTNVGLLIDLNSLPHECRSESQNKYLFETKSPSHPNTSKLSDITNSIQEMILERLSIDSTFNKNFQPSKLSFSYKFFDSSKFLTGSTSNKFFLDFNLDNFETFERDLKERLDCFYSEDKTLSITNNLNCLSSALKEMITECDWKSGGNSPPSPTNSISSQSSFSTESHSSKSIKSAQNNLIYILFRVPRDETEFKNYFQVDQSLLDDKVSYKKYRDSFLPAAFYSSLLDKNIRVNFIDMWDLHENSQFHESNISEEGSDANLSYENNCEYHSYPPYLLKLAHHLSGGRVISSRVKSQIDPGLLSWKDYLKFALRAKEAKISSSINIPGVLMKNARERESVEAKKYRGLHSKNHERTLSVSRPSNDYSGSQKLFRDLAKDIYTRFKDPGMSKSVRAPSEHNRNSSQRKYLSNSNLNRSLPATETYRGNSSHSQSQNQSFSQQSQSSQVSQRFERTKHKILVHKKTDKLSMERSFSAEFTSLTHSSPTNSVSSYNSLSPKKVRRNLFDRSFENKPHFLIPPSPLSPHSPFTNNNNSGQIEYDSDSESIISSRSLVIDLPHLYKNNNKLRKNSPPKTSKNVMRNLVSSFVKLPKSPLARSPSSPLSNSINSSPVGGYKNLNYSGFYGQKSPSRTSSLTLNSTTKMSPMNRLVLGVGAISPITPPSKRSKIELPNPSNSPDRGRRKLFATSPLAKDAKMSMISIATLPKTSNFYSNGDRASSSRVWNRVLETTESQENSLNENNEDDDEEMDTNQNTTSQKSKDSVDSPDMWKKRTVLF